jgi:hypothetical protein
MYSLSFSIISNFIKQAFLTAEPLSKEETFFYKKVIGKIMYTMVCTRLDIVFAINFLGRFAFSPIICMLL